MVKKHINADFNVAGLQRGLNIAREGELYRFSKKETLYRFFEESDMIAELDARDVDGNLIDAVCDRECNHVLCESFNAPVVFIYDIYPIENFFGWNHKPFCERAIARNGSLLMYVPVKLRDVPLCAEAARQTCAAWAYMPDFGFFEKRTLYTEIARQSSSMEYPEIRAVIEHDGFALRFVPREKMTLELCYIAIRNSSNALLSVPLEWRTLELCQEAVKYHRDALQDVPDHLRDHPSLQ